MQVELPKCNLHTEIQIDEQGYAPEKQVQELLQPKYGTVVPEKTKHGLIQLQMMDAPSSPEPSPEKDG